MLMRRPITTNRPSVRRWLRPAARLLTTTAIAAVGALAITGTANAAECKNPDALTFAMVPTEETVAELELYKPVTDRMAKLTGKKIQFFMPTSYASVVEGTSGRLRPGGRSGSLLLRHRIGEGPHHRSVCDLRQKTRSHAGRRPGLPRGADHQEGQQVHQHRIHQGSTLGTG